MTATKLSARQKLELSQLRLTQQELMGEDVDIHHLNLQIKNVFGIDIAAAITDATIDRTIEGASTLTLQILDRDRKLLRSGRLGARTDVRVDGLWFRLAGVSKQGDNLELTFEDREIAILRTYFSLIKASAKTSRANITRAQFVLRLIREVKEFRIPWIIPDLEVVQPIEEDAQNTQALGGNDHTIVTKGKGIPHGAGQQYRITTGDNKVNVGLQVKGQSMTNEQIDVANAVLNTAASMNCTRPELVMGIMCAIQESTLRNLRGGDRDSVGVFQQRHSQGWPASRNIARDARAFFTALKTIVARHPHYTYSQMIQGVQNSAFPDAYARWRTEAEHIVTAYGNMTDYNSANAMQASGATQGDYEFYRGVPPGIGLQKWQHENSWTCIQRLAQEVNWRSFFVSGTFYLITEEDLMSSKPAAIIRESKAGIEGIDGNYDVGQKTAEVTITCRMGRWSAPPGSVILLRDMGPMDGRWLISTVRRSLFDSLGTITLKKARPAWPEPISGSTQSAASQSAGFSPVTLAPVSTPTGGGDASHAAKKLLQYHAQGKYRDDNGRQIAQLKKVAAGQKLHNECGKNVEMNAFVLNGLLQLIEQEGLWVGTFALCEDHSCNEGQHPRGQAVDISSLGSPLTGWHSLKNSSSVATGLAKQAMRALGPTSWDLICNGVGRYDSTVQALQKDNAHTRGGIWESDHTNHIHYGVVPGRGPEDRR